MITNFETQVNIISKKNLWKILFSSIFNIQKSVKTQIIENLFFRSLHMEQNLLKVTQIKRKLTSGLLMQKISKKFEIIKKN